MSMRRLSRPLQLRYAKAAARCDNQPLARMKRQNVYFIIWYKRIARRISAHHRAWHICLSSKSHEIGNIFILVMAMARYQRAC